MTSRGRKDIAASVRQRLLNKAKSERRPFNEFLQYYAMERFLFRLSKSPHADKFVLKGALMLILTSVQVETNYPRPRRETAQTGRVLAHTC